MQVGELRQEFDRRRYPDDKIRVILRHMAIEGEGFRFNGENLHTAIFEAKSEHPDLFEEFTFRLNGTHPYSELLERVINRGKISRVIKTLNPDFSDAQIKEQTHKYIVNTIEKKFSEEELEILRKISKEIQNEISVKRV